MSIWFTSDTHYFHKKVIEYCNRPFSSVEEMNEALIANYNRVVKPEDTVFHLGDFAFASPNKTRWIHDRLNGRKVLIMGNHDADPKYSGYEKLSKIFEEIHVRLDTKFNGVRFVLDHYPIESWNKRHRAAIHLHGHSHGSYDERNKEVPNRFDVGVDCWNYAPVALETILKMQVQNVAPDRYSARDGEGD